MIEDKVKTFFSGYAVDFDSIYGDGKKRGIVSKFFDDKFRSAMFGRYKNTIKFAEQNNISSVLDIGCGSGVYMQTLNSKGIKVAGVDLSEQMINLTRKRLEKNSLSHNELVVGSYLDINLKEKYDISILMGFFDYIQNPHEVLIKAIKDSNKHVLASFPKKGGLLYFQRRFRYWLRNCPLYFYSNNDLQNLLKKLDKDYSIIDNDREFFVTINI